MLLYEMLKARGLDEPAKRPIYAYQVTSREYEQLQGALRERSHRRPKDWANVEAAEFCIFAAEWWRRNYAGGYWSWEGLTSAIGAKSWNRYEHLELVERGLQYLNREVIEFTSSRQFLGTLATEGGLPLKLITSQKGALIDAFREIFEDFKLYTIRSRDPRKVAHGEMWRFPQVYQQAEHIPKLLGEIAYQVWDFAAQIEGEGDYLEELDREVPNWKSRLPLQVADDEMKELLAQILGTATKYRAEADVEFELIRNLERDEEGEWNLSANFELPRRISSRQLAENLGVDKDSLPYALKLKAKYGGQERFFASASRRGDYFRITSTTKVLHLKGSAAAEEIRLAAYDGPNEFGESNFILAESLGDEPWIFVSDSERPGYTLLATGSINTRESEAFVAVTEGQQIDDERGVIEELFQVAGRRFYQLMGEVSFIEGDGTRWRIRCDQPSEQLFALRLQGLHWSFEHAQGLPIYSMKPELWVDHSPLEPHEVYWISAGGSSPIPLTDAPPGDGRVQILDNEGAVMVQRRICRLPDDAGIRVFSANNRRPGFLRLQKFGHIQELGSPDSHVEIMDITGQNGEAGGDFRDLQINYSGPGSPSTITLSIRWEMGAETSLKVPFPREIGRFISAEHIFPDNAWWVAHSLSTIQAEVVPQQYPHSSLFVEGKLIASDISDEVQRATSFEAALQSEIIRKQRTGRYLLSLGKIRREIDHALAGTMDLDAHVELRISWYGIFSSSQQRRLRLYRYEGKIKRIGGVGFQPEFRLKAPRHWGELRLIAFRFQDPSQAHELTPTTDGEWLARLGDWEPGTWCVVGIRDGHLSHRPHIFTIEGEYERTEWAEICEIPNARGRREELRQFFEKLAQDFDHPAWRWIGDTFELAKELPATTFDSLDCLVMAPRACATAFVKAGEPRIEGWWSRLEELPFFWQVISIADWKQAFEIARQSREHQAETYGLELDSTAPIKAVVEHIRNHLGSDSPAFIYLDEYLNLNLGLPTEQLKLARERDSDLAVLLELDFEELLRRRPGGEQRWPTWKIPEEIRSEPSFSEFSLRRRFRRREYWRQAVLDAPVVAAMACAFSIRLKRTDLIHLRQIRKFDPLWFDHAYHLSLIHIIAKTEDKKLLGETSLFDAAHSFTG